MRRRRRGMSILEVLVAYGILTIAVLGLLGALPAAARQQRGTSLSGQALYLAQQKMDQLLQQDQRLATAPQSDYPFGDLTLNREWWGSAAPGNPDVQIVHVKVTWIEDHRARNVVLRSYVIP